MRAYYRHIGYSRQEVDDEITRDAISVACPTCGAPRDRKCDDDEQPNYSRVYPHESRIECAAVYAWDRLGRSAQAAAMKAVAR